MAKMMKSKIKKEEFAQRIKEWGKQSKQEIKAEVERNYRVVDTRGLTKDDLINMMLEAEGWFSMVRV